VTGHRARLAAVCALALLVTGCGGRVPPGRAAASHPPVTRLAELSGRPQDLIGLWRLEASGEAPGTVLRIGQDLSVWRPCSVSWGAWAADGAGYFVADLSSYSYGCAGPKPSQPPKPAVPPPPPTPSWLTSAHAWRVDGAGRLLEDATGRVVAKLLPGGRPIPNPNAAPELSAPPSMDAALAARLRPARPLPATLSPATASGVLGTWYPASRPAAAAPTRPFITLSPDGNWTGSDGCNATGGRWTLEPDGAFLATGRGSTLMLCAGEVAVPRMDLVRRLAFSGRTLVLVDADGADVARFART